MYKQSSVLKNVLQGIYFLNRTQDMRVLKKEKVYSELLVITESLDGLT